MVDDEHLAEAGLAGSLGNVEHFARSTRIALLSSQIIDGAMRTVEALLLVVSDEGKVGGTGGEIVIGCFFEQVGFILDLVGGSIVPVADIEIVLVIFLLFFGFDWTVIV